MTEPPPRGPPGSNVRSTGPSGQPDDKVKPFRVDEVEEPEEIDPSKDQSSKRLFRTEETEEPQSEEIIVSDPSRFKGLLEDKPSDGIPAPAAKRMKIHVAPTEGKAPSPYVPRSKVAQEKATQKASPEIKIVSQPGKRTSHTVHEPLKPGAHSLLPVEKHQPLPTKPPSKAKESQPLPSIEKSHKIEKKIEETALVTPPAPSLEKEITPAVEKKGEEELQVTAAAAMLPPPGAAGAIQIPLEGPFLEGSSALSPMGKLDTQTALLFHKIVGLMMIETTKAGISTTTTILNMPGSVFDGTSIVLTHYDTNPHGFNLQLLGSPQAVSLFMANSAALGAAFRQEMPDFRINILTPALTTQEEGRKKGYVRGIIPKNDHGDMGA